MSQGGDELSIAELDPADDPVEDERPSFRDVQAGVPAALAIERKAINLAEKIPRLHAQPKVKEFATVDIETKDWVKPYAVGFYGSRKYWFWEGPIVDGKRDYEGENRWKPIDAFLDFFLDPRWVGVLTYAHNGGNFDFLFLLWRLMRGPYRARGFRTDITPIQSCMFRITVTHPGVEGKWTLIDSTRLLPMKLEDLGEKMGVGKKVNIQRKLGCKEDAVYDELAKLKNRKLMLEYLEQDCKMLHKGVARYQSIVNAMGGEMKGTTPATSLDIFRRAFQTEDIYRNKHFHTCPDLGKEASQVTCLGCGHEYTRRALAGGRTEIFTMKSPPGLRLYYMDYCSMYPAVMLEPMPAGMATVIEVGGNHDQILKTARSSIGLIDCEVYVPETCYLPPLAVKYDGKTTSPAEGGKLIFPTGRFRGVWDTAELALLPECGGRIERVYKQVWFEPVRLFGDYIKKMYGYRDKGAKGYEPAWDALAKLMMNSLFGKTAQKEEREEVIIAPPDDMLTQLDSFNLECDVWTRPTWVDADHIAPQIAVHVTALARAKLWRAMNQLLSEGAELYYCDTDSIVYAPADPCAEPKSSNVLGELKHEHTVRRAEFVLPKLYLLECDDDCPCHKEAIAKGKKWERTKVRAKGFGPGLGDVFSTEDFMRLTAFDRLMEERSITRRRLVKFKESLREYERTQFEGPRVKLSTKAIRSAYDKRDVLTDGNRTMPLIFNHDERIIRQGVSLRDTQGRTKG